MKKNHNMKYPKYFKEDIINSLKKDFYKSLNKN